MWLRKNDRTLEIDYRLLYNSRRFIGLCLWLLGIVTKTWRWQNLGWYMLGVGLPKHVPKQYADLFIRNDLYQNALKNDDLGSGWHWTTANILTLYDNYDDVFEASTDELESFAQTISDINYSVGKFMLRKHGNIVQIMDEYIFYPTCPDQSIHGRNCHCSYRTWNRVEERIVLTFPRKLGWLYYKLLDATTWGSPDDTRKWQRSWCVEIVNHTKSGYDYEKNKVNISFFDADDNNKQIIFELHLSDELFSKLGRSFWTVQTYVLKGE